MGRTPGDPTEGIDRFREGLSEYLTADGARRLLEAIDAEAVLDDAVAEDVPTEEVARTVGRIVGRVVAKEATSYLPLGQVVEAAVGRAIGEKIGEGAVAFVIEYGSVAAILARVERVTDRIDLGTSSDRAERFDVRERASGVREYVPGLGSTETVWEAESATSVPVADEPPEETEVEVRLETDE